MHDDDQYSQTTWDARYSESSRIWSGNPNPRLVEHVSGLPSGTALDVGAGEGADAVWLAQQGWDVTALDISEVALGRTAEHAAEAGVADRVRLLHHDLIASPLVPGEYDLVTAQFWHPPAELRTASVLGLAAAVRPGGLLLIVGHHPDDVTTGVRQPHGPIDRLFTPDQVVAALAPEMWEVRVAQAATRDTAGPHGVHTDSVVLAARR